MRKTEGVVRKRGVLGIGRWLTRGGREMMGRRGTTEERKGIVGTKTPVNSTAREYMCDPMGSGESKTSSENLSDLGTKSGSQWDEPRTRHVDPNRPLL